MITQKEVGVRVGERLIKVRIDVEGGIHVGGRRYDFSSDGGLVRVVVDDRYTRIYMKKIKDYVFDIWFGAICIRVNIQNPRSQLAAYVGALTGVQGEEKIIRAPMPGLISSVKVSIGDTVVRGAGLLLLEAMKMENEIISKIDGRVKSILVKERSTVEKDQELIVIEPITGTE